MYVYNRGDPLLIKSSRKGDGKWVEIWSLDDEYIETRGEGLPSLLYLNNAFIAMDDRKQQKGNKTNDTHRRAT